jgi:hypothetical protein
MPTVPFHAPGITYNGLHSTVDPTAAQVSADLATTKQHFVHVRTYYPQYSGGAVDVGKLAKDAGLNLMLSLFLFDGHPDWIEGNYQQFVKPAVARGNITAILIGNEDPQMIDTITQYLQKAKADLPQVPVGTSQTIGFWLTDSRAAQLLPVSTSTPPGTGRERTTPTTSLSASRRNQGSIPSAAPITRSRQNILVGRSWSPKPAGQPRSA